MSVICNVTVRGNVTLTHLKTVHEQKNTDGPLSASKSTYLNGLSIFLSVIARNSVLGLKIIEGKIEGKDEEEGVSS